MEQSKKSLTKAEISKIVSIQNRIVWNDVEYYLSIWEHDQPPGWNVHYANTLKFILKEGRAGSPRSIALAYAAGKILNKFEGTEKVWNFDDDGQLIYIDPRTIAGRILRPRLKQRPGTGKWSRAAKTYDPSKKAEDNYQAAISAGCVPINSKTGKHLPFESYRKGVARSKIRGDALPDTHVDVRTRT